MMSSMSNPMWIVEFSREPVRIIGLSTADVAPTSLIVADVWSTCYYLIFNSSKEEEDFCLNQKHQ